MDKKTVLYIRVSTQKQNKKGNTKYDQMTEMIKYCEQKNITSYEIYDDGGHSGKNAKRPNYTKMLNEIKEGKIERVITFKVDRLNRNSLNSNIIIKECQEHNVELKFLDLDVDIHTPEGELTAGIVSGVGQFESQMIGVRTSSGYRGMLKKGLYPWRGDLMALGISKAEDKTLYHNEDIEIVKEIFDYHLQGYSNLKIGDIIKEKYPKINMYKTKIQQILTNTIYMGYIYHGGNKYDVIEPIVQENELIELSESSEGKCKLKIRKKRIKYKHDYELSKTIKYEVTGSLFYCQTTRKRIKTTGKIKEYKYYFSEDRKIKIRELYLLEMFKDKMSGREEELKNNKNEQRYRIQKMLYKGQITGEEYNMHLKSIEKDFMINLQMDINISIDGKYNITLGDNKGKEIKFNYLEELKKYK